MRFSYGRVAFFEDFGRWKIRCYFGDVLGGSWGEFWEGFVLLNGFQGFEERSNFEAEVGTRKSGFKVTQEEVRGSGTWVWQP